MNLALGGGGARGYAHIGVLEVLEERGYEIASIAGTSMGALVGALYAAGALDEYAAWARQLTQRDVLRLLDPAFRAPGAIRATKVFAKVAELLGDRCIEDLPIPYTAVATDLTAGREVWFQRGPLAPAVRASIALPSFITPVMIDGRLLADGGLLNPIPVAATTSTPADLTIAVSLAEEHLTGTTGATAPTTATAPSMSTETTDAHAPAAGAGTVGGAIAGAAAGGREFGVLRDSELVRAVTGWFAGITDDEDGPAAPPAEDDALGLTPVGFAPPPPGLRTVQVMQLSVEALQASVTRFRLAANPPDLLITVPRGAARALDFHRAPELIALGRARATEALEAVHRPGRP
ncbi:MAG: patatin-like phospholipase family protein [Nitriliruptoraceae bacterium]